MKSTLKKGPKTTLRRKRLQQQHDQLSERQFVEMVCIQEDIWAIDIGHGLMMQIPPQAHPRLIH